MRITLSILFLVMTSIVNAETLELNGKSYDIETKQSLLNCSKFSILKKEVSLPFTIRENSIPYEITMKHMGNPHLISEKLFYVKNENEIELPKLTSKLVNYKKIDPKHEYTIRPVKCLEEASVLLIFWSGGNCSTVCEAYAKVQFIVNGEISSITGLTYKEYNALLKGN